MTLDFRLELIGKKVLRAERDEDGVGIQLTDGWNIAIWACSTLFSSSGEKCSDEDVGNLVGSSLLTFAGDATLETLIFDNGYAIVVELNADPGSVAESMAVYGPANTIVVWE